MKYLAPIPLQFVDHSGIPYSGGKVAVYNHGDTTLGSIYADASGSTVSTNPVVLDSNGAWKAYVTVGTRYDYVVKDVNDNVVFSFEDVTVPIDSIFIVSKADKVADATAGHLASLTEDGNIEDSGYAPDDFASKEEFDGLCVEVNGKADKDNVVTDVTWDSETRKIKKTINGEDYDVVQVQQSINQSDPRPINSKAVKDEKYLSVKEQSWTGSEKEQARRNINAIEGGFYTPKGGVLDGIITKISWSGFLGNILSVTSGGSSESGHIPPVANVSDRGKVVFVKQFEGDDRNELVYRFILENCDTNAKVIAAVQNGQIPYHTGSAGKYLPYIIADNGDMYLYNIFGVSDKNPMTGDALGLSLRKKVYNGNVVDDCYWGKPYGINNFKLVEYSANDDYGFNIASKKMVWRRIPFDSELTITKFAIVTNRDNHNVVQPTYMVGIFDFDGANVINVSESSTWTYGNMEGFSDTESVARIEDMQSYYGFGDYYIIEFTLPQPLVLQRGGNYLFPCYCNDAVKNGSPTIISYKSASPALPWEELWTNTAESGNPVPSTAKSGCKASALRLTLSDGTEMWI